MNSTLGSVVPLAMFQYCAHHSPPEGVGIAGEVRLAPGALRVLLRQVDEVAEQAKFDDQKNGYLCQVTWRK